MFKKLAFLLVLCLSFAACKKNKGACGTQLCTADYAYFGVSFTDSEGKPTAVKDIELFNVSTGKPLTLPPTPPAIDFAPGFVIVATDDTRKDFSTNGDDIRLTATSSATGQVKQVAFKISGGCNCHVNKISGPETVKFD